MKSIPSESVLRTANVDRIWLHNQNVYIGTLNNS